MYTTLQFHWSLSFPGISLRIQVCVTRPCCLWECLGQNKQTKCPDCWGGYQYLSHDYHMTIMWLSHVCHVTHFAFFHIHLHQESLVVTFKIVPGMHYWKFVYCVNSFRCFLGAFGNFPSFVSKVSALEGFHCGTKIVMRSGNPLARWSVRLDRCFPGLYLEACVVMKAANVYIKAQD